jgi:hypothetical protein
MGGQRDNRWARAARIAALLGPAVLPHSRQMAAVLASGPAAVLSHQSAGKLRDLLPYVPNPASQDVTVPGRNPGKRVGIRLHRVRCLTPDETTAKGGIPDHRADPHPHRPRRRDRCGRPRAGSRRGVRSSAQYPGQSPGPSMLEGSAERLSRPHPLPNRAPPSHPAPKSRRPRTRGPRHGRPLGGRPPLARPPSRRRNRRVRLPLIATCLLPRLPEDGRGSRHSACGSSGLVPTRSGKSPRRP